VARRATVLRLGVYSYPNHWSQVRLANVMAVAYVTRQYCFSAARGLILGIIITVGRRLCRNSTPIFREPVENCDDDRITSLLTLGPGSYHPIVSESEGD